MNRFNEEEKYLNKAMRVVFKTVDLKQLSPEALTACDQIGVKPESLFLLTVENFRQSQSEPEELAHVRLAHYLSKRKSKFAQIYITH